MSFAPIITPKTGIGATADVPLQDHANPTKTLITFSGSSVGNVTVLAKVAGGTLFNAVTDGTIDLATRDYIYIPEIPLESLRITYSGAGTINARITQYPTV